MTSIFIAVGAFVALVWFVFRVRRGMRQVSAEEAHRLARKGATILDVRSRTMFRTSHLPRARNIPLDELGARFRELGDTGMAVIVYCTGGNDSREAVRTLRGVGFRRVHELGSMARWQRRA